MTKTPFTRKGVRAADILGLVHTDVCGPMSTDARGGFSYFITFKDDHSRYGFIYLMKFKHETFEKFKEFKQEVERQTGKNILTLRSDRGGEYLKGYPKENVGYYFYNSNEMKVIISKHVIFLEKELILRKDSGSKVDLEEVQETTNKIDQLDVPMAELASDEVRIEKVGTTSS
ncbi:Uncharacterized protein Adt_18532 [Abeliophyllum distichum]|uniref:Retroviral polymerase SH3-like domain-containing protein n=1 Tax=Abeliophyllum distichum TaxID=126358 RepID=A0ABD1TJN2_9LAMI